MENIHETAKSQFVGKLIGLGVLKKNDKGKLIRIKNVKKEDVISGLKAGKGKAAANITP